MIILKNKNCRDKIIQSSSQKTIDANFYKKTNTGLRVILLLIILTFGMSGFFKEEWEGFVYPNKNNLTDHISIGIYNSLDECRSASVNVLNRVSSISQGDYECGLNCKSKSELGGIKVCQKTER